MLLVAAACDDKYDDTALWDKVNDHEERIAALEKWQEQTNQSIAAMQELLNTTDFITAVTTLTEGGDTLGYTISFQHGDPITIYNGAKGEAGADGQTPSIGLEQATDGNWYWTLNGETLTDAQGTPIRANGIDGQDGADGQDGQDGVDGEDGQDGATGPQGSTGPQGPQGMPAPTPQISLGSSITSGTIMTDNSTKDDSAWYLSVDNCATWYRVSGKDGADGTGGTQGDSWFSAEPKKDGNYYIFTLTSGGSFNVAAYLAFRILTEAEKNNPSTFENATVSFDGANTIFYLDIDNDIDYQEIVAQISSVDAVLTRAGVSDWKVEEGTEQNTLTVTSGDQLYALLDVSLILKDGSKLTASRLLDRGYFVDGTTYTVTSAYGLKEWAKKVNDQTQKNLNCTLAADIDLTDEEWTSIDRYQGTFNGNNHTIKGLKSNGGGLFSTIDRSTVKDLTLEDVQITSNGYAGGVVGQILNSDGTVTGCSVSGSVTSTGNYAGGVVGYNNDGTVTGCSMSGSVTASGNPAGGVVRYNDGTVTACYHATGTVSGSDEGGVVGRNTGTITTCYWSGSPDKGIGNGSTGETTKVDGTDVTWTDAVTAMNSALQNAGSEWQYELIDGNELPTLKKKE